MEAIKITKDLMIFLKELGGVNLAAILIVYSTTAAIKKTLLLNKLKDRIRKLSLIIFIPLAISFFVSIIFVVMEKNCSPLYYIKQVLINFSFSGLAHKIFKHYFS